MTKEHQCSEYADIQSPNIEYIDGLLRGTVSAECCKCGKELTYEYVLDKIRTGSGDEVVTC